MLTFQIIPKTLRFKKPAGTSRGVYTERKLRYIVLKDTVTEKVGVGECAPLPALSCDDIENYEELLSTFCETATKEDAIPYEALRPYPSMLFGLETAFLHLKQGSFSLYNTAFSRGERSLPINGLIWMGSYDEMAKQIAEKLEKGFRCLKLKIGAISFQEEVDLLKRIRSEFSAQDICLRVDANGAFSPQEAMQRLETLATLELHSIEQPIRAGQWEEMRLLCKASPLPIALDEELIGVHSLQEKAQLLDTIRPPYIILKPSLHGGITGCEEWIKLAEARHIGYWVTSALESNIGLNAIAQWCATLSTTGLHQGLGTGALFVENIHIPLHLAGENLSYDPTLPTPDIHVWLRP